MRRTAGALLVGAIAAAYFAAFLRYGTSAEDEGLLLMQFARTFRGELPYVDFHTGYPPATFYLNATLFRLFGESVIPLRTLLVVVNATTIALLFALAQPLAGTLLAATVALGWAAYLPLFGGHFAAFNVPYPSWYALCAVLAAQLALDRHLTNGRTTPLLAAGVAGGVAFAFEQNSGALAVVACGLVLAILRAGERDPDRLGAAALMVLGAAFLLAGFTSAAMATGSVITIGPTIGVLTARLVWARGTVPTPLRLWPAIGRVALGALLPSIPWLVAFLPILGIASLAHGIFLVGTDLDLVHGSPYPLPPNVPEVWPLIATAGLAAVAWLGGPTSRRVFGPGRATAIAATGGAAMLGALAWVARMPEGVLRAVVLQVQHLGFYAAPLLVVAGGATLLHRVRTDRALGTSDHRVLGALVFATCLFALLHPRVGTTHLVLALPSSLVLGAWAAHRIVRRWAVVLEVSARTLTTAVAGIGIAIMLAAVVPNFASLVAWDGARPYRRPQAGVASERVPVGVEVERGEDVRALNALLDHLRRHVEPDDVVFAFPSLALVPFALGLRTATPHDAFFAGRPDHLDEAVVVRRLREAPPRWVLTLNRRLYAFHDAPAYYFVLRDFLRSRYELAARFGRYDVLRRRDIGGEVVVRDDFGPDAPPERTMELLADVDAEWRRAGARNVIGDASSGLEVVERANRLAPDETRRLLVVRGLGAIADPRAIPYLLETFHRSPRRLRNEAAGALTHVALGTVDHQNVLAGSTDDAGAFVAPVLAGLDPAVLREALADEDARARLGAFALWALTERGDRKAAPIYETVVREETSRYGLQAAASYALGRLGYRDYLCKLPAMLGIHEHEVQDTVPSLLLNLPPSYAADLADCLARGLAQPRPLGREVTAWIAGSAKLAAVAPALEAALDDRAWRVRVAAIWALGMLRHEPARARLAAFATDADPTVRGFADEAIARLDGAPW